MKPVNPVKPVKLECLAVIQNINYSIDSVGDKVKSVKLECLAVIQNINYSIDSVGDKVGSVKLTFSPTVDNQDLINRLQLPGQEVKLTIEANGQ